MVWVFEYMTPFCWTEMGTCRQRARMRYLVRACRMFLTLLILWVHNRDSETSCWEEKSKVGLARSNEVIGRKMIPSDAPEASSRLWGSRVC